MRFLTFEEKLTMDPVNLLEEFQEAQQVLANFSTPENMRKIAQGVSMMHSALANGQKIMSCGNGGSMCDAMHFAEELTGFITSSHFISQVYSRNIYIKNLLFGIEK